MATMFNKLKIRKKWTYFSSFLMFTLHIDHLQYQRIFCRLFDNTVKIQLKNHSKTNGLLLILCLQEENIFQKISPSRAGWGPNPGLKNELAKCTPVAETCNSEKMRINIPYQFTELPVFSLGQERCTQDNFII